MSSNDSSIPQPASMPDPEVPAKAKRRTFSAAYNLRILAEVDAAERGQIGDILRREGLYSSHLDTWRRLQRQGSLATLTDKQPGRTPTRDARDAEIARLMVEHAQLQKRLTTAETIIDVQKTVSQLLGLTDLEQ